MSQLVLTQIIIETSAPLAINSGGRETGFDSELARDANQLPYIPATAIAGVWRHLAEDRLGTEITNQWFGNIGNDGESSRLYIHDGLLLDSTGQPIQGLQVAEHIQKDPLLRLLHQQRPHHRERVRINDRGVASDQGKFDQIMLPTGVRFCLQVRWQGAADNTEQQQQWQALLELLTQPDFALGSSTRNGLGRFNIIADRTKALKLHNNPTAGVELQRFIKREQLPSKRTLNASSYTPFATLGLTALDGWRCGQGSRPIGQNVDSHTDSFTYSEPVIRWQHGKAQCNDEYQVVLCGSSIKGILAHRLAYHYNRHTQAYAEQMADATHKQWQARPSVLRELLGEAEDPEQNLAGCLFVDDTVIHNPATLVRTHTSIDRFTGGVRQGVLFSEELLWQPTFELVLRLAPNTTLSPALADALRDTLNDLKHGLLPMGAGSGRGNSLVEHQSNQVWQIDWSQVNTREQAQ